MPTSSQASLTEAEIVQMELEDLTNPYFQVLFLHVAMFFHFCSSPPSSCRRPTKQGDSM